MWPSWTPVEVLFCLKPDKSLNAELTTKALSTTLSLFIGACTPGRGPLLGASLNESIKSIAAVVFDGTQGGMGVMQGLQKFKRK